VNVNNDNDGEDRNSPEDEPAGAGAGAGEADQSDGQIVPRRKRKSTGDPELDELWAMSIRDLQKVVDDESHPLHGKAKQVAREMMAPIQETIKRITQPTLDSIAATKVDIDKLLPKIDTSWASKFLDDLPRTHHVELPPSIRETTIRPSAVLPASNPLMAPRIDFESLDLPDASAFEVQLAADEQSRDALLQLVQLQSEMLTHMQAGSETSEEALKISRESLAATKDSVEHAKWSKYAAWAAAIVGLLGIAATVLVAIL